MATPVQNDDDLIILSDNINTSFDSNPVISQNIDFWDNNSIISFDSPIQETESLTQTQETTNQLIPESDTDLTNINWDVFTTEQWLEPKEEIKSIDNSMNNLFWDVNFSELSIESENQNIIDTNTDTNTSTEEENVVSNDNNIDLSPKEDIVSSNYNIDLSPEENIVSNDNDIDLSISLSSKEEDSTLDMNTILNNTIDKLKLRQTGIELQKSTKIITINDLEAKIKELREQVTSLKKEIVFLDEENVKIEINIWSLESMKLWKASKAVNAKVREHNTKKVVKEVKALPQKS